MFDSLLPKLHQLCPDDRIVLDLQRQTDAFSLTVYVGDNQLVGERRLPSDASVKALLEALKEMGVFAG